MLHLLTYSQILNFVVTAYTKEFGDRKVRTIYERVMTSNKISGLISNSKFRQVAPNNKDFLYCLNEIPYFIFARGQTQAVAALMALEKWNEEVNSQLNLLDEYDLKGIAINIIEESKATFF